mgnify:CR=1 FL=1
MIVVFAPSRLHRIYALDSTQQTLNMTQLDLDMQNVWRVKNQPSVVSSNSQVEQSRGDLNYRKHDNLDDRRLNV